MVARFLDALQRSASFEEAAHVTLRRVLDRCAGELAESAFAAKASLLRAMVHLRPGGTYRGLVVLEHTEKARSARAQMAPPAAGEAELVPSATAWRWVAEHRMPVAIDVHLGIVEVLAGAGDAGVGPGGDLGPEARQSKLEAARFTSRATLLGRDATHVLAVPFGSRHGGVEGMISIEADCRAAMGSSFVWARCAADLRIFAAIAAPYLAGLPWEASAASPEADELLPVVGPSMSRVVRMVRIFARQAETLLLSGPTGSGKSRLARFCHERSPRAKEPLVTLDLQSVPETMQMAELFGWKRGAFTGAVSDHRGAVDRAQRGTLFLDEIDKLSLQAQAGLLRLLEERRYRVLGDAEAERQADVRFIAGTNVDLEAAVAKGQLREDLYYRIQVLPIRIPPLDDRADEVIPWAEHMVRRSAAEAGHSASLAAQAGLVLAARRWPGNLRQLDNVVRRASVIARSEAGDEAGHVIVEARHVEEGIALEGARSVPADDTLGLLRRAAAAFAAEAERTNGEVGLDLADAFRGLVLEAAVRRTGSREGAFRALGKEPLLRNRNHHKTLRREVGKVIELCRALGRPVDPALSALSEEGSGDTD